MAALLLRTHKGGHDSGRSIWSNSPLPELPPSALAGDRATRRQGEKGPVQVCGPELPPSRKTGGVQATSRRRTQNQAAAKASNGTVMHARTPTPGRSRDVRATRRRARLSKKQHDRGGARDATDGGDVVLVSIWRYIHGAGVGGGGDSPNSPDVGFGDNISIYGGTLTGQESVDSPNSPDVRIKSNPY